jgi:hypothetical protein
MARHTARGSDGRFTPSGAPIPTGDDHQGADPLAGGAEYEPDQSYSAFSHPYPTREFTNADGSYSPLRHQLQINAQSGQELDDRISHVNVPDMRTVATHVVSYGDENGAFYDLMQPEINKGGNGRRLRSQAVHTDDAPVATNAGVPQSDRHLFR